MAYPARTIPDEPRSQIEKLVTAINESYQFPIFMGRDRIFRISFTYGNIIVSRSIT